MTLARPAWTFTVTNLDNPWTYTATAGDDYDDTLEVQLAGQASLGWQFEDGQAPGQTEPDTLTFGLIVQEAAELPAFDKGDRITASLLRPLAVGTTPYKHFFGRITDADTELDAIAKTVTLSLICVDPLSELSGSYDFGIQTFRANLDESVGEAIRSHPAAIYNYEPVDPYDVLTHYPWGEASIRDHCTRILNTAQTGIFAAMLRSIQPSAVFPIGWSTIPGGAEDGRSATIGFYPHKWKRGVTAIAVPLLKFAMDAADPDRVILITNPDADPFAGNADDATLTKGLSVIPASVIRSPLTMKLNRGSTVNRLELGTFSGWAGGAAEPTPVALVAEDSASVTRYGASTRSVETYGNNNQLVATPATYLAYVAPGATWAADELVLLPHKMTDAQLDQYANKLAPQPTVTLTFRRHIAVLDIEDTVDVTAGMLFADLVGATFNIEGGELTITLKTKPASMYLPNGRGGPTLTQWAASAYADTRLRDQGGAIDYIDPELTLDHVAVSKL